MSEVTVETKQPSYNRANMLSNKANFLLNTFFWIYSAICIFPMILIFAIAFSTEIDILRNGYKLIPENFSLDAFKFLFIDWQTILKAYGVQFFVVITGALMSVIMMALYAYPISRPDFPHRRFFSFFAIFTLLFNGGLIPWYLVYVNVLGLRDSIFALIMPFLVSGFWILVMRTFFQSSIPPAVLESAKIDGAGEFRIFTKIVFPLSMPVLASVALFQTLLYWNDFFLVLVYIKSEAKWTVQ